jgi:hypothetical protein
MTPVEEINRDTDKRYHALLQSSELVDELASVQQKTSKLFSSIHPIDKETTELFRAMCILSQCGSRTKPITSHRPIIGKLIVCFKKITWRIIEPQLKHILDGVSDCFSCLILSHAKLIQRINQLETEQDNGN